jgi:hypothetical protein
VWRTPVPLQSSLGRKQMILCTTLVAAVRHINLGVITKAGLGAGKLSFSNFHEMF